MKFLALGLATASLAVPTLPAIGAVGETKVSEAKPNSDGQLRCKKSPQPGGIAARTRRGALLRGAMDRQGDRATGAILTAAAGALLGRQIDRGRARCK